MFITEDFISFIWIHSNFDHRHLRTTDGQDLTIINSGHLNKNSGPDFLDASIRINDILWAGAVEIHVKTSDWYAHKHQQNSDYDRVILHVVWKNDSEVWRADGSKIPTLELKNLTNESLVSYFQKLIYESKNRIPCSSQIRDVRKITILNMIHKALMYRLERKSTEIFQLLSECNNHWEEVSYRLLMKNFGFKVNQDNMLLLSHFLPLEIIKKHNNDLFQLEALLYGLAGFLEKPIDGYQRKLKKEYDFLKHKYGFGKQFMQRYQWKFLRLRPQNFPTIRIAQLAFFLSQKKNIFSFIIDTLPGNRIQVVQSRYWQQHYDFNKKSKKPIAGLGEMSQLNIMINTIVPVLFAYSGFTGEQSYADRAVKILESIPPEKNQITEMWVDYEIQAQNSADSQGLIELSNQYCYKKQCLNCNIGTELLLNNNQDSGVLR